jgi:phosphoribosylamine---glycine ligase
VVVEAYLDGEEASFFCLSDGKTALALATAQDHKRVGDGDTGPNTGGMGAYSPAPVMTPDMVERTMKDIIQPTISGMADSGMPFTGVFFAGLMITDKGPELIEYNVRFGDPETQVLMMRLKSDLLPILYAASTGTLDQVSADWHDEAALTVVMASKGYPGAYDKATPIAALPQDTDGAKVFHAGTALQDGKLVATGGRVLNLTGLGTTVADAQARAYALVDAVEWDNGFCRRDIGWRAIGRDA